MITDNGIVRSADGLVGRVHNVMKSSRASSAFFFLKKKLENVNVDDMSVQ